MAARTHTTGTTPPPAPTRLRPGPRPGTETARRGGQHCAEKYGPDFYRAIGKKGGTTLMEQRGADHYREIGRKGGTATKQRMGLAHYQRIGSLGGLHRWPRTTPPKDA